MRRCILRSSTNTSVNNNNNTAKAVPTTMAAAVIMVAVTLFTIYFTTSAIALVVVAVTALQPLQQQQSPYPRNQNIDSMSIIHPTTTNTATSSSRRDWLYQSVLPIVVTVGTTMTTTTDPCIANAAEFAPGGSMISDREIGILVNNPNASPLRKYDNSNVLFDKDYYYKFGTGMPNIEPPGNTSFPKNIPFTKSQQRYDALKKYRERIVGSLQLLQSLPQKTKSSMMVADPKSKEDVYQLRAMGLLANGLLASDNNGLPNEVFLARYYINEIYLRLIELTSISSTNSVTTSNDANVVQQQQVIYSCIEKATNSYLTLMNRAITTKVGEPFPYVTLH